ALNSAVRQAKRLLRGSYAWQRQARRSKKRSKEVAVEPAPLPSKKKQQQAQEQQDEGTKAVNADTSAPDVWTKPEIAAAVRGCKKVLKNVKAQFVLAEPVKRGPCGNPAPYRLASLGQSDQPVVLVPPATLNCKMIVALDRWIRRDLQRLARKHLGSPITRLTVMSSYSCRNAYGRTSTRLSEHAKANALDIGGFVTADGKKTQLLAHWGPTKRDLEAEAQRLANAQRTSQSKPDRQAETVSRSAMPTATKRKLAESKIRKEATTKSRLAPSDWTKGAPVERGTGDQVAEREQDGTAERLPALPERRPSLRQRMLWTKAERNRNVVEQTRKSRDAYRRDLHRFLAPRNNLGGPKPTQKAGSKSTKNKTTAKIDRAAFLRGAHHAACRIFGTVLGPEANDAHRNHFHVDLAHRRRSNYCR
ncbi:MAG: extensin family protein, partial [Hyphomicrobiaceae bacterium]